MDKEPIVYIYGLVCPFLGNTRYIGKTKNNPEKRYKEHLAKSKLRERNRKNNWIKSLLKQGKKPGLVVLKETNEEEWRYWERYYIKKYRDSNDDLTNYLDGGDEPPSKKGCKNSEKANQLISKNNARYWKGKHHSEETKNKISEKIKIQNRNYQQRSYKIITPDGEEILIHDGLDKFCRKHHLSREKMVLVAQGRRKQHKNYMCMYVKGAEMLRKYTPSDSLLNGIENTIPIEVCPWDEYYMRMAQTDFFVGNHNKEATKAFFIRKAPFGGSFAILGGLTHFLYQLSKTVFDLDRVAALQDLGYRQEFIDYLHNHHQRLDITVHSIPEGSVFFSHEPAIIIKGDLISVRIAEGILLNCVNYPTLSMTKWNRVCAAGSPGKIMEFARRRAQDSYRTSLYAYLAGTVYTSNAEIRAGFNIPLAGTQGHEYILSFGDEYAAFDNWLEKCPGKPVLLVDTIDTLHSGVPNAVKAFDKHWDIIKRSGATPGIRNDSGDLAYLAIEERKIFNSQNMSEVLIYQTNDLDEYSIEAIKNQIVSNAPKAGLSPEEVLSKIVWGCGTNPGTCSDQPSLGGVMKLTSIEYDGKLRSVIKIARDNPIKTSIPGYNLSSWVIDKDSKEILCSIIHGYEEDLGELNFAYHFDDSSKKLTLNNVEFLQRQALVYDPKSGILINDSLKDIRERVNKEVSMLHWTLKRLENPHTMKVSLSRDIFELRQKLIMNNQLMDK
jgi:nicotinate phosphoribosyltransferase